MWDLLQDVSGLIALYHVQLSPDHKHLITQAAAAASTADDSPDNHYIFHCPQFTAAVSLSGLVSPGSLYIREKQEPALRLPIAYLRLYPTYLEYLQNNVEGKARVKKRINPQIGADF